MKTKKLFKLVKADGLCTVMKSEDFGQWIGSQYTLWRADHLPALSRDVVRALFDLDEGEEAKTYSYEEVNEEEVCTKFDLCDADETEVRMEETPIQIGSSKLYSVGNEFAILDKAQLGPVEKNGYTLFRRTGTEGEYIAVFIGFSLVGIIGGYGVISGEIAEMLGRVSEFAREHALDEVPEEDDEDEDE